MVAENQVSKQSIRIMSRPPREYESRTSRASLDEYVSIKVIPIEKA